jgi:hypothetical protein
MQPGGLPMAETNKATQHWLFWWMVDQDEIAREVEKYALRNPLKTARGVAALCFIFSALVTFILIAINAMQLDAVTDAVISLVLALFMYFGHRWAMIGAMIWWTLEKVMAVVGMAQAFNTPHPPNGGTAIVQVIWWCIYMHAFWLAFRVERARRRPSAAEVF